MAKTFELKTTLSADSNNSSLFVDDTADYLGSPTEAANVPSAVVGLGSTAFGGNMPFAGARPEGGEGTATVSDTPNPQSVADVAGNGNYLAGWSTPADGAVTSSLLVGDPASQSTGANGNVAPPDTDNSLTPTLSVNAQNPADVVFTVSGLGSGYSGTVTFTDSTNESDVIAIKGNGTYSANLSNLADGTLTYLLKASDPAGNVITVDPTTTLGLPPGVTLQPINGGPDYYANNGFTYAAKAGWDNPSFFPIGPSEEAVTSEADVTLWHGLNWNTAFDIQANFDLALAGASTGIWVIQNISDGLLPGTGAETVGLITYDEPSTFAEGVTTPLSTTANSIQDGRFWYINNTWNFIAYGGLSPVNSSAQVLDTLVTTPNGTQVHIDASSIDAYWFSGANISSIQGELGLLDNLGGNGNATAAEVARGSNYGDIITDEEAITGGSQPIFGFVETGGPYTEDTSASDYITPSELNWAVWSELIHGANGIDYFDHSFAGPAVSDSNVQDAYYQTVQPGQTVSIYTQIQQTDALVTQLAPVLNSPTALGYVTVNNAAYENGTILSPFSGIEVMAKDDNGQFYIFADTADALTQTNIAATFTIADTNATSVTVVGENRTIPVVDGVFSDTFATAATVHIYEVNDGGSSPPPPAPAAPVISTGVENSNESVTLTGTAPDGSTVTVSDGGTAALGTVTASSTGAWSFTTADLAAGSYAFTATDTTSAGTSAASNGFDVTVASSSPPSGSNLVANGNFATDSLSGWTLGGNSTSTTFGPEIFIDTDAEGGSTYAAGMGSVGSDGTLSQTIATTAGQTYTLSFWLQNEASGTNDFSAIWNGQTLLSLSNAAQSGYTEYTYTVTATGSTTTLEFSAANGPSQWDLDNISLTANSTPPTAPVISTGVANSNESVTLTGTAPDGSTVTVSDGGAKALGTATASSTGAWSFTTADLAAGSYAFTATDTTSAGTSAASSAFDVTVTSSSPPPPAAPVISTGVENSNESVTLTGTASDGSTVTVSDGGAAVLGTATASSTGVWSFTTADLAGGSYAFTATDTTSAGTSAASSPFDVTVTPPLPAAPVISSGVENSNESVTLTGTAPDGSTVTVSDGGATALGTATASSTGAWSFTTADLAAGSYAFTATDTTSAGTSAASSAFDVTVASSSPPPSGSNLVANGNFATDSFSGWTLGGNSTSSYFGPEIFIDADAEGGSTYAAGMGSVGSDGTLSQTIATTAGQTYTLSFWLQNEGSSPNDFSAIWNGQTLLSLTNAAASGYTEYTYTVTATSSTTTLEFSAANGPSQWDLDNVSLTANATSTPPPDPPTAPVISTGVENSNESVTLTGTAPDGSTVTVSDGGAEALGTATASSTGAWSFATADLSAGSYAFTATDTTTSTGNVSTPSSPLNVKVNAHSIGAVTIGTGATFELAAADSASVTFNGSTGTLILENPSTFSGKICKFTGNGSLSGSDQIDLTNINFNSVQDSYANGVLTVTDGTNTDKLNFHGSYTLGNFSFASDGSGGTIVYDPPVPTSNVSVPTSSGQTSGGQGRNFTGIGSGFEAQEVIDLPGIAFDAQATLGYLPGSNQTEGTLPFMDGAQSAKIALLGSYMASSFTTVGDHHSDSMVTEAWQASNQSLLTHPQHA